MEQNPPELGNRSVLGWGNRGWLEIIDLVLSVCDQGTLKTHVMYKCNLNSRQVQDYLELLLKFHLLAKKEADERRTVYETTDRGRRFIKAYSELFEIFDIAHEDGT